MLRLIVAFVEIALHRRGPDQIPASPWLFGALLVVALALEAAGLQASDVVAYPVALAFVHAAADLAFLWAVLKSFGRERRFRQTASALLGIDTLLLLLVMLLIEWHKALEVAPTEVTVPSVLIPLLELWSIDVTAFALARALDRPYLLCIALVIAYVLLWVSVRQFFFPVTGAAA